MADEGRVAVVTGGSRGIGRAIVEELAALGMNLVVNYRVDAEAAQTTCREAERCGARRCLAIAADVGDIDRGRSLLDQTLTEFGRVDLWINNAGIAPEVRHDLLDATPESWDRVLNTNLRGPFFVSQAVAREMVHLKESGTISDPVMVFVTSISSVFASVNRADYCVSKAGLSMVAQLFAARLAEQGIRVFELRPGIIATDMTEPVHQTYDRRIAEGLVPLRRWGSAEDVGRAVAAIASGAFPFSTGEVIHVDGGMHIARL